MYINFKLLETYGLTPQDVPSLQAIFQNKREDNGELIALICDIEKFEQLELVSFIKGTAKASKGSLMRLSPKGARILEEIQTPNIIQDDLDVYAWLEGVYKKEGKEVGNMKKTKVLISQFRANSGIERNHLAYLCKSFLSDEKEMEYSKRLEYLFWKPSNIFQTKFDIEQSRLYQYYLKRKEQYDAKFLTIKN
jgi:hypothetical protein